MRMRRLVAALRRASGRRPHEMMLHPRPEHPLQRGKPFTQPNRLPFRHFAEHDLLFENVTTAGDGPPIDRSRFPF